MKWELDGDTGDIHSDGTVLCKVYGATKYNRSSNAARCKKAARLIAAAPEMYRLLCDFLRVDEQKTWASTEKNEPAYMMALVAQDGVVDAAKELLERITRRGCQP